MSEGPVIFVINLEARTDRRREMSRQLDRAGLRAEFFPAVRPEDPGGFPSIGARGCFESHLSVLKQARSLDAHVAVIEDDLNFDREFRALWPQALRDLPDDWSIFYPAHREQGLAGQFVKAAPDRAIICAHFVMFHAAKIGRVVDGLEAILSRRPGDPRGGPMHVDGAYSTVRRQNPDLATYLFTPSLGYQRSSRSDIEGQRFFDRYRFLGPGVDALRRLKSGLVAR